MFTTLNKKAKPVAIADIIALDEDDLGAICARRLVDEYQPFRGERIAIKPSNNLDASDVHALTTIKALFDVCWHLFKRLHKPLVKEYKLNRPPDPVVDDLFAEASGFFTLTGKHRRELREFMGAKDTRPVVARYRGTHVLFRPVGLSIFAEVVAERAQRSGRGLEEAIRFVSRAPLRLDEPPFRGILWDPRTGTMTSKGRALARDLLRFSIGEPVKMSERALQKAIDEHAGEYRFSLDDIAVS